MSESFASIHSAVAAYYTDKVRTHGATPAGVDWNSQESQDLRLQQLLRVCEGVHGYSLLDFGCGYGRLLEHLRERGEQCHYIGWDLSEDMVAQALERFQSDTDSEFHVGAPGGGPADFVVASGIFNVRGECPVPEWEPYVLATLDALDRLSVRGFAFNCLTAYSDEEYMREDLYYADPSRLFEHCMKHYGRQVALCHDYGLYEFTIVVRKPAKVS